MDQEKRLEKSQFLAGAKICRFFQPFFLIHPLPIHYPLRIRIHYESIIHYVSVYPSIIHHVSLSIILSRSRIHFLGTLGTLEPLEALEPLGTLGPNIGPKVQNHPKSSQIQCSFRVDFGLPFVHLTKFHRFSASFFGAHLFSFTIFDSLSNSFYEIGQHVSSIYPNLVSQK